MSAIRVRFAPSPTGSLHLGGLRTALYNYLLSRSQLAQGNGKFILRIEDTDQSRLVPGATHQLIRDLEWAGLPFDEGPGKPSSVGPFVQSQRLELYRKYAHQLVAQGHAYKCYCSPRNPSSAATTPNSTGYDGTCRDLSQKQLDLHAGQPFVIRFRSPRSGLNTFFDHTFKHISVDQSTLDDIVLLKSDGWPTYHLASVVDDHLMGISHVMRGHEWLPSTPKHILLYQAFGWNPPQWVHLPLLLNKERKKLSKREGDKGLGAYVSRFRDEGYHPEALLNFIGLLGWTANRNKEVLTVKEMQEQFGLERLHVSPAVVDLDRLDWLQKSHFSALAAASDAALVRELKQRLMEAYPEAIPPALLSNAYLRDVLKLISTRLHRTADITHKSPYFWLDPDFSSPTSDAAQLAASIPNLPQVAQTTLDLWTQPDNWPANAAQVNEALPRIAEQVGMSKNVTMLALRCMVTGTRVGAGLADTVLLLGREAVERRIRKHVWIASERE
ncbi:glutamate--tRNA ligase [Catenaria anguillulae PL171]|uniref:Glutamate--tRNA ligase, mitochondrial n=1 Tax=Catenaria anguillulae PL171 TaxID=765915 RepID=A0A1Y2HHP9_9FUNG|nr:glutamate--tRNA ligase [Catenaria anguillulae PL171]